MDDARNYAALALPRETGGIALGWRTPAGIEIVGLPEIADPRASQTSYERSEQLAAAELRHRLTMEASDSPLGYVGEWHTHLAPRSPSWQDRRALKSISRRLEHPVVMLVVARRRGQDEWAAYAVVGFRARVRRARVVMEDG